MFPKMGSCVRARMWVSLVKEASDTGGIPSPLAHLSGLWLPNLSPKTAEVLGDEKGDIWLGELDQQWVERFARGHGRCLMWCYGFGFITQPFQNILTVWLLTWNELPLSLILISQDCSNDFTGGRLKHKFLLVSQ